MTLENAVELLSQAQHRMTRTRLLLLETIVKMKNPFSAADLVKSVNSVRVGRNQKKSTSLDLVTVYRNLPIFEETGIICRSDFSEEMTRYVLSHPGHAHHHHHIVCRNCQRVEAIDACLVEAQEKALAKLGFKEIRHKLEFSGICRACS